MSNYSYEGVRRVFYFGCSFVPVCVKCGRFVKADDTIIFRGPPGEEVPIEAQANATCKRCGRVAMPCEGFV